MSRFTSFDTNKGFRVQNLTNQDVYLKTGDGNATDSFTKIGGTETSNIFTAAQDYPLLDAAKEDADLYLTIKVNGVSGSVTITSGNVSKGVGKFIVTTNFT